MLHHHTSFFLFGPSCLSLIRNLAITMTHPDHPHIFRSLIFIISANPLLPYKRTCTLVLGVGKWDLRRDNIPSTTFCPLAPKELCLSHIQITSYKNLSPLQHQCKVQNLIVSHHLKSPDSNWENSIMFQDLGIILYWSFILPPGTRHSPLGPWFYPRGLKLHPQSHPDFFSRVGLVVVEKIYYTVSCLQSFQRPAAFTYFTLSLSLQFKLAVFLLV